MPPSIHAGQVFVANAPALTPASHSLLHAGSFADCPFATAPVTAAQSDLMAGLVSMTSLSCWSKYPSSCWLCMALKTCAALSNHAAPLALAMNLSPAAK